MALRRGFCLLLLVLAGCAGAPSRAPADLLADPPLLAALRALLCRVEPYCGVIQLQVRERPTEQAEMFPDGRLQLHLGLLLATRDEAEVAFILAHETAHRRLRHRPSAEVAGRLQLELEADADAARTLQRAGWANATQVGAILLDRLLDSSLARGEAERSDAPPDSGEDARRHEDLDQMRARIAALRVAPSAAGSEPPSPAADWNALLAAYRTGGE